MVVIMITLIGIYYRTDDNNLFILFSLRDPIAGHTAEHTKCHLSVRVNGERASVINCNVAFRIELATSKCIIIINIQPPQQHHHQCEVSKNCNFFW